MQFILLLVTVLLFNWWTLPLCIDIGGRYGIVSRRWGVKVTLPSRCLRKVGKVIYLEKWAVEDRYTDKWWAVVNIDQIWSTGNVVVRTISVPLGVTAVETVGWLLRSAVWGVEQLFKVSIFIKPSLSRSDEIFSSRLLWGVLNAAPDIEDNFCLERFIGATCSDLRRDRVLIGTVSNSHSVDSGRSCVTEFGCLVKELFCDGPSDDGWIPPSKNLIRSLIPLTCRGVVPSAWSLRLTSWV